MPVLRAPASLEELSIRKACDHLNSVCRQLGALAALGYPGQRVLDHTKRIMRPYYVNTLPGAIRSRMIAETSRSLYELASPKTRLFPDPTPAYLLTILLGPDIKKLKVHLCCYYGCSHQTDLLKLLASEGIGIESLELSRSTLLRLDCHLLRGALHNMRNLRSLTIRNIASDAILETIGRSCPDLVILDIGCSQQVTDMGIQKLLLKLRVRVKRDPIKVVDRMDHPRKRSGTRHRCNRNTTWSRIKSLLTSHFTRFNGKLDKRQKPEEFLLDICETRNSICDSLRFLNIDKTSVTKAGVLMLLAQAPNVESLGDYCSVARAIESKDQELGAKSFELRQARDSGTTFKRLRSLAEACPRLEKLWIFDPRHPAVALRAFGALTSLSIDAVPAQTKWIEGLYDYLRTDGVKLTELNLRLIRDHAVPEVDLGEILINCPNLVSFTKEGGPTEWLETYEETGPLMRLQKVQIGDSISPEAFVNLLKIAPELNSIHVHSCNQLNDRHLDVLRESISVRRSNRKPGEHLNCLFIEEAKALSLNGLRVVFESCRNLRQIGNLGNWDLSHDEIRSVRKIIADREFEVELRC